MHGKNAVRHQEHSTGERVQVHKVWYTIQGEGPFAGMPAVFVRLSGCNLRCWFCDTHWDDATDPYVPVTDLVSQAVCAMPPHCRLVVITGGEPARQNMGLFIERVLDARPGTVFQVETSGSLWMDWLDHDNVYVVVCPKTPRVDARIASRLDSVTWKYVIEDGRTDIVDGLPARGTQLKRDTAPVRVARPPAHLAPSNVYLSPCDEGMERRNQDNANAVGRLAMRHGYRAGVQMHKIINVE